LSAAPRPRPKAKRGFTETAHFVDSLRACLGLDPLYRSPQKSVLERFYQDERSTNITEQNGGRTPKRSVS
jgi:hypothetical protein